MGVPLKIIQYHPNFSGIFLKKPSSYWDTSICGNPQIIDQLCHMSHRLPGSTPDRMPEAGSTSQWSPPNLDQKLPRSDRMAESMSNRLSESICQIECQLECQNHLLSEFRRGSLEVGCIFSQHVTLSERYYGSCLGNQRLQMGSNEKIWPARWGLDD